MFKKRVQRLLAIKAKRDSRSAKQAFDLVVEAARQLLAADPGLDEFVMAMGSYHFSAKPGGCYDSSTFSDEDWESDRMRGDNYGNMPSEFAPEFAEMVAALDDETGVLGTPVRFKHGTKAITNWGAGVPEYELLEV